MNAKEYCSKVNKKLVHLTGSERRDIFKELSNHIEDSKNSLVNSGYSEEDAEALAINSMGEPSEVAKELQKAYSPFWLWTLRFVRMVAIILVLEFAFMLFAYESNKLSCNVFTCKGTRNAIEKLSFGNNNLYIIDIDIKENENNQDTSENSVTMLLHIHTKSKNVFKPDYNASNISVNKSHASESNYYSKTYHIRVDKDADYLTIIFNLDGTNITAEYTVDVQKVLNQK